MTEELTYIEYKKKPKEKKVKTESQKKEALRKMCVKIAKEISKLRDKRICKYCGEEFRKDGKRKQVHSHHIFHEGSHKGMSADVDNLITLCSSHHQSFSGNKYAFSFHGCPTESTEWLQENWKEYPSLKIRSLKLEPLSIKHWERKKAELDIELKELKSKQ